MTLFLVSSTINMNMSKRNIYSILFSDESDSEDESNDKLQSNSDKLVNDNTQINDESDDEIIYKIKIRGRFNWADEMEKEELENELENNKNQHI